MKDDFWILPFAAILIAGGLFSLFLGAWLESYRIYEKCLDTNKLMTHAEAVKVCKEVVSK